MKFVDLFCGCGGLSLGLEKAGMKPIVSIDNLKEINLIHKKNFKHYFIECDLKDVKKTNKPAIFISGHLSNFELMAMTIEKFGIKLAAIYRPLNNHFLNILMERIRKKYICKHQIKKGIGGLREIVKLNRGGFSTALMIDQRVSQGIKSNFFNQPAFTTTIPAQLVKKYNYPIVPLFIERFEGTKFKIKIQKPIYFSKKESEKEITEKLNIMLEKMILIKPGQWIWSHNRWKK